MSQLGSNGTTVIPISDTFTSNNESLILRYKNRISTINLSPTDLSQILEENLQ